ncbi:MAG: Ig-like domain-containing protein [Bacillota bacterium]|nr:Ig-like domain-containing protein [Bacillota bacterium]
MRLKKLGFTIFSIVLFLSLIFSCSIYKINAEETSKLYIDYPKASQVYDNTDISISGWALDKSGINSVEIYKDGTKIGSAQYGIYRPDVNKVFPGYPSENNSGYKFILSRNNVSGGTHTIKVKAINKSGGYLEKYVQITMKKPAQRIYIDNPKEGQTITGKSMNVSGWAQNPSGVKSLNVYVDNILKGQADYGVLRYDVNKAYPGYPSGNNAGYSYTMDISSLTAGKHTVKAEALGNDGSIIYSYKNINIFKLMPKLYIDYPRNYQVYDNKNITVSGWTVNPEGVKSVEVLVDGNLLGQATYGLSRTDVSRAYPGYPSGNNPGYSYNINVNTIAPGNHTIKVISNGNDGSKSEDTKWITVKKLAQRATIDYPNMSKYYNDITVSGWALNQSGVTKIDVLLDGNVIGQAAYGISRSDVNKVYPGYPSGDNSGFKFLIGKDLLINGIHTVGVRVYGQDGTSNVESKSITYEKLDNEMKIETPNVGYTSDNQDVTVKGYALIPSGTKRIDVILDNVKIGEASFDLLRSDVAILFPQYSNGKNSGFSYTADVDSIAPGSHVINVKVYGIDGTSIEKSTSFNLTKPVPRIYIDYPREADSYYMEDIKVSGWALNASGVKTVNVYLNNKLLGQAAAGIYRSDVDKAYPGYKGGLNSGYSYSISKSLLSTGSYTVKVEEIGYDGTSLSLSKTISVDMDKVSTVMALYDYPLETELLSQIGVSPQTWVSGIGWQTAGIDDVKYYLDPNNFKNDPTYKYQFLVLNYTPGITVSEINTILSGKGVLDGCGSNFLNASYANNVSVAYAVSHALLETGNGTSPLATGYLVTKVDGAAVEPKVVYNMFGIGAYDYDPLRCGTEYAYKKGWFTKTAAIEGGIKWISNDYINNSNYKQNTLYKMRWNPASPANHQYATDIKWANSQTYTIKKCMDLYPNAKLIFEIPSYNQQ